MICDRCHHLSAVGRFPDGQDMPVCDMEGDPRLPFDMEEYTEECPCFEPKVDADLRIYDYCRIHKCEISDELTGRCKIHRRICEVKQ